MQDRDMLGNAGVARKASKSIPAERLSFIRKVYTLFFAGLMVACGGVYLSFSNPRIFAAQGARFGLLFATIGLVLVLGFSKQARRVQPWNYFLLFGITFLMGLTIGPWVFMVNAVGKSAVLLQAFIMTAGVFGGLTAYAFISRKDFSFLRGFVTVGLIGLILATLVYMFIPGATGLGFVIACVGVLVFAAFTLYDTSQIMQRYDTSEYVAGALSLFLDFFNLFLYIAQLFLGSSRD